MGLFVVFLFGSGFVDLSFLVIWCLGCCLILVWVVVLDVWVCDFAFEVGFVIW